MEGRIPIAKEGLKPVGGTLGLSLLLALLGGRRTRPLAFLGATAGALLAFFYRDPVREIVPAEGGLLSPADGKVIEIAEVEAPEFLKGRVRKVSIFMSLLDCHVNRAPAGGRVAYKSEAEGEFLPAFDEDAGEVNRRKSMGIEASPPLLMRQIAGLCARQVVQYPNLGERVEQGDKIGMIVFGSRVDVFFPAEARVTVSEGDRVWAGVTMIAESAG